jgi:hypothetical protein
VADAEIAPVFNQEKVVLIAFQSEKDDVKTRALLP